MPIFQLSSDHSFPDPSQSSPDGIIAVGGDTHPHRLLAAYRNGIFPWPHEGFPLLWFSPDPRLVLEPNQIRINKTLQKILRKSHFEVKFDANFEEVITNCAYAQRKNQTGTWINHHMIEGYIKLFEMGFAHCVETYDQNKLVGGLYGIAIGNIFFGESMFSVKSHASKIAFVSLVQKLQACQFQLIDCQQETPLLKQFGAKLMPRKIFLEVIEKGVQQSSAWQRTP